MKRDGKRFINLCLFTTKIKKRRLSVFSWVYLLSGRFLPLITSTFLATRYIEVTCCWRKSDVYSGISNAFFSESKKHQVKDNKICKYQYVVQFTKFVQKNAYYIWKIDKLLWNTGLPGYLSFFGVECNFLYSFLCHRYNKFTTLFVLSCLISQWIYWNILSCFAPSFYLEFTYLKKLWKKKVWKLSEVQIQFFFNFKTGRTV